LLLFRDARQMQLSYVSLLVALGTCAFLIGNTSCAPVGPCESAARDSIDLSTDSRAIGFASTIIRVPAFVTPVCFTF